MVKTRGQVHGERMLRCLEHIRTNCNLPEKEQDRVAELEKDLTRRFKDPNDQTLLAILVGIWDWLQQCQKAIKVLVTQVLTNTEINDDKKDNWIDKVVASFPIQSPDPTFTEPFVKVLESDQVEMHHKHKLLRYIDYFLDAYQELEKEASQPQQQPRQNEEELEEESDEEDQDEEQ